MINQERLWSRIHELSQIGRLENGGMERFSFTEIEREAKDLVISYMKQASMEVTEDAIGNIIGRKEGMNPGLPAVLVGSHIDTVPSGGIFDGALGVLAGIEVVQSLSENNMATDHPIEVIAFTDEEGARFGFGMIGSRAMAGTLTKEQLQHRDEAGVTIEDVMRTFGYDPEHISTAARDKNSIKAYLELHIEQGKVLEHQGLPAGIVTGIAGPLWMKWTLTGEAGHAGATPMGIRKDPLMAAAKIMQYIEAETKNYDGAVATVGQITVKPGGINVIPKQAEFTVDLRSISEDDRNEIEEKMTSYAENLCKKHGIGLEIATLQRVAPAPCAREIQAVIEEACHKVGVSPFFLPSGAGHDGMQFKGFCPVGMIFVRSKDGISHNPKEWSSKEDCAAGTEILYETVLKLSNH